MSLDATIFSWAAIPGMLNRSSICAQALRFRALPTSGFAVQSAAQGLRFRALPTETKVESGTSQSKSGTSVNLSNSGYLNQSRLNERN